MEERLMDAEQGASPEPTENGLANNSSDAPEDMLHQDNEATYRRLLDAVDLDKLDEDTEVLLDEYGQPVQRPRRTSMDVHGGIKITDPQVLDLFVVFGKPFALEQGFWTTRLFFSIVQGVIMGFVCLAFFNGFDWLLRTWLHAWGDGGNDDDSSASNGDDRYSQFNFSIVIDDKDDKNDYDDDDTHTLVFETGDDLSTGPPFSGSQYLHGMQRQTRPATLGTGHFTWIIYTTLGGLVIGLIKITPFVHFPRKPKGLFAEVKDAHVEARESPGVAICSCISLGVGASVGPEMAMGSLGGGLGTYIAHLRNLPEGPETYSSTLTGMAAAMGPLLPSPILSVLLLHELCVMAGKAPEHFMEQVVSFGIASTTSWFIYTYFMEDTLLESAGLPFAINDLISCDNLSVCHDYKDEWLAESILFGFISGVLGLSCLIIMGIFRTVNQRMELRMGKTKATLIMPMVGGLLIGLIGVAFPLTFGDGSLQLRYVVGQGEEFGRDYLIATLFMKMIALGISLGFGFIGGQIFPIIFIGACAGSVATIVSDVPIYVTVPCFMSAVPGAFCPIPFTLVGIVVLSLGLGNELTALVFTSTFCSFMTACGSGFLQRLVRKGGERQAILAAKHEKAKQEKAERLQKRVKALENENKLLRRLSSEVVLSTGGDLTRRKELERMLKQHDAVSMGGGVLDAPKIPRGAEIDFDPSSPRAHRGFLNHKSPYL